MRERIAWIVYGCVLIFQGQVTLPLSNGRWGLTLVSSMAIYVLGGLSV